MRFTYDDEVDTLMVQIGDVTSRRTSTKRLEFGGAIVDLAEDGTILAIEIGGAAKRYGAALQAVAAPDYEQPIALADAARTAGTTPQALRKAIERGRLRGEKIGRNYTTTTAALTDYLNSKDARGRKVEVKLTKAPALKGLRIRYATGRKAASPALVKALKRAKALEQAAALKKLRAVKSADASKAPRVSLKGRVVVKGKL